MSRFNYYESIMQPLQRPLLECGARGMPLDELRLARHRRACERLCRMANAILAEVGDAGRAAQRAALEQQIAAHEAAREVERVAGSRKYSAAKELLRLRTQLKGMASTFNSDSHPQRARLLYETLCLPPKYKKGTRGLSTDDETLLATISQIKRGTLKVERQAHILRVLHALVAAKKWATWRRSFLDPPIIRGSGRPRVPTEITMHRAANGQLSSGLDNSDMDKGARVKRQQLMNVPKKLRDMFRADEGCVMVGADWSAIQWCIALWYASKQPRSRGYHEQMFHDFQAGKLDPHRLLASKAFHVPESHVTPRQRRTAKQGTFGYLFGGYYVNLAQRLAIDSQTMKVVCEAHDTVFRFPEMRSAIVAKAKKDHCLQTPLGWRRYFWAWKPKPTEAIATLVAATAADLLKWVLVGLVKRLPEDVHLLVPLHDAIYLHAPVARAEEARTLLVEEMAQPVPWLNGWRFKVEAKTGGDWMEVS